MNDVTPSLATQRNLVSFKRFIEARLDEISPQRLVDPDSPLGLTAIRWQDRIERELPESGTWKPTGILQ